MMTPEARTRLTQSLELPGAAAWCVCTPERAYAHHCFTDWFKPAQLEAVVAKLAGALEGLRQRRVGSVQACWVFEHARLFVAQRANGDTLALFVENRPELITVPHQAAVADFAAGK
jgi:hypothetical protein